MLNLIDIVLSKLKSASTLDNAEASQFQSYHLIQFVSTRFQPDLHNQETGVVLRAYKEVFPTAAFLFTSPSSPAAAA